MPTPCYTTQANGLEPFSAGTYTLACCMLRDLSTRLPVTSIHPYFEHHGLHCRAHREEVDRHPDPCTSFYEISRLSREVKGPFCTNSILLSASHICFLRGSSQSVCLRIAFACHFGVILLCRNEQGCKSSYSLRCSLVLVYRLHRPENQARLGTDISD